jgi:hypothetical protein
MRDYSARIGDTIDTMARRLSRAVLLRLLLPGAVASEDPDLAWIEAHTADTLAALTSGDSGRAYGRAGFSAAADPRRPSGYTHAAARDLAAVIEHAGGALAAAPLAAAVEAAEVLLRAPGAGGCDRGDEAAQLALLLAGLANATGNGTLYCAHATPVASQLLVLGAGGCNGSSAGGFLDGLVYSRDPLPGYGFATATLAAGHQLVASALLHRAAAATAALSTRHDCVVDSRAALQQLATTIAGGLAAPILWDDVAGLYHPGSLGVAAVLHDVWGSAIAAAAGGRVAAVSEWLASNWASSGVFQHGSPRHLAPGQFWPSGSTSTWQRGTFMNGGHWPLATAAVLPLLARADPAAAAELARNAVRLAAERGGVDEWTNAEFCSNCRDTAVYIDRLTPYPSSASLRGVARHGASTAGLCAAARAVLVRAVPAALRRRVQAAGSLVATGETDAAWVAATARQWLAGALVSPPSALSHGKPIYPPAADPNAPSAYGFLYTRDFAYVLEFSGELMSGDELCVAAQGITDILQQAPAVPAGGYGVGDEMPFRAKLVVAFAALNHSDTNGSSAPFAAVIGVCAALPGLWTGLNSSYGSTSFHDGLLYSAQPMAGYGFTDSIAKSGHRLFISVLHFEALEKLIVAAASCPGAAPAIRSAMREQTARLKAALAGPLLWNQSAGMFRPSSGNCAGLLDVWGSALAVRVGATTAALAMGRSVI